MKDKQEIKINAIFFHSRLIKDLFMDFAEKIEEEFGEVSEETGELGNGIYESLDKLNKFCDELKETLK